jgi:hypothetical protein
MKLNVSHEPFVKSGCFGGNYTRIKVHLVASDAEIASISRVKSGTGFPLAIIKDTKADMPIMLTVAHVLNKDWQHEFFKLESAMKALADAAEGCKILKSKMELGEMGAAGGSASIDI